ncbi:hypothetical protein EVAR_90789_1 [Eumeta japonica]|uniref:Uncharacterized protein n=1 Tax=Eumeta variegata TaxID=151549 RepID=A0A4C2AFK3_EUMVA|nr:hypothetical protein EVAR_90789_1 [Eumeta japonica]
MTRRTIQQCSKRSTDPQSAPVAKRVKPEALIYTETDPLQIMQSAPAQNSRPVQRLHADREGGVEIEEPTPERRRRTNTINTMKYDDNNSNSHRLPAIKSVNNKCENDHQKPEASSATRRAPPSCLSRPTDIAENLIYDAAACIASVSKLNPRHGSVNRATIQKRALALLDSNSVRLPSGQFRNIPIVESDNETMPAMTQRYESTAWKRIKE